MSASRATAVFVMLVTAAVVVGGWGLGITALRGILPGFATMKVNTALGLAGASAALWLLKEDAPVWCRRAGWFFSAVAILIGMLTLTECFFGWNLGIDELFFPDPQSHTLGLSPGRPAPNTALGILLLGLALLFLDYETRHGRRPAEWLALAASLIAFVGLLGYAYGVRSLYAIKLYSSMALHTAFLIFVLAMGTLCARAGRGLMAVITGDSAGGYLVRRLLPSAILVPPIVAGILLAGERAGLYDFRFGMAMFAVSNVAIFATLVWWNASSLHGLDARRKRAETALRESEERFRLLTESALTGVYLIQDNLFRYVNPAFASIFGYAEDELVDKYHPMDLTCPQDRALVEENIRKRLEDGVRDIHYFFKALRKDGEIIDVEVHGAKVDYEGRSAVVGTLLDVTERKRAEAEIHRLNDELERRVIERTAKLKAANEELESFSYSVSHDLRAPLRTVDGYSCILLEEHAENLDDAAKDHLTRIRLAAQHMGMLIDDLLNLARVTRLDLQLEEVDLSTLAQEIVAGLQEREPGRNAHFDIALGICVPADPRLLRIVFDNLLGNAWKFTSHEKRTHIEFGTTEVDGEPVYFIRDNGAGFDMAYADRLFGAFQRLHDAAEFPGTGIGLATVQRIVHKHGGRLWAESAVDRGATFYFTLAQDSRHGQQGNLGDG